MTIKQSLKWAAMQLKETSDRPLFEAEILLAHHLRCDRIYLITHETEILEDEEEFMSLVQRRSKHEPCEYIVGEASFYDIYLYVKEGVLIPRPETEILVEVTAEIIKREKITSIAEIGVGTGAISIVLARKFHKLKVIATDISKVAIETANKNINKYGLKNQISLCLSNLIDKIDEPIELVVSNPPYIAQDFVLESNIIAYEPKEALFGGKAGDELLKQIIVDVKERGIKWLACEMGYDQKESIQNFVNQLGVQSIEFYKDLAGFDRGFVICFADKSE